MNDGGILTLASSVVPLLPRVH